MCEVQPCIQYTSVYCIQNYTNHLGNGLAGKINLLLRNMFEKRYYLLLNPKKPWKTSSNFTTVYVYQSRCLSQPEIWSQIWCLWISPHVIWLSNTPSWVPESLYLSRGCPWQVEPSKDHHALMLCCAMLRYINLYYILLYYFFYIIIYIDILR